MGMKKAQQEALRDLWIDEIGKRHLRLETVETRNSDRLDFSVQAVWQIKEALEAAYEAGRKSKED
jgi:hypothetical protein